MQKTARTFLDDVLWAQYCLFLFIRIQDDILDRQAISPALIFGSDQFLFEAERVFLKYFDRASIFWDWYRMYLRKTISAILEVDWYQQSPRTSPKWLLNTYARVDSIFKIGPMAVCSHYNQMSDFPYVDKFADETAMAGQILDDLADLVEDLERQRYNYAANAILRKNKMRRGSKQSLIDQIVRGLLLTPIATKLLDEIRTHLQRAFDAIRPLGLNGPEALDRECHQEVESIHRSLHRRRVETIFGKKLFSKRSNSATEKIRLP